MPPVCSVCLDVRRGRSHHAHGRGYRRRSGGGPDEPVLTDAELVQAQEEGHQQE